MSLTERLHRILVKLRESFDSDLPDPATLMHSGEVMVKGHPVLVSSSAPQDELVGEEVMTVYLHAKPREDSDEEAVRYFHFEGRKELGYIYVMINRKEDGTIRQQVSVSSLPREIVMGIIDRHMGRGAPRERRGGRGGGDRRPMPPMIEE